LKKNLRRILWLPRIYNGYVIFWEVAVDKDAGKIKDTFPCPHCQAELTKRNMERAWATHYDSALEKTINQAKQMPVLINYSIVGQKGRFEKKPDEYDFTLIEKVENTKITYWYPSARMMEGKETRRNDKFGITHAHHFYTKRNLWIMSFLRSILQTSYMEAQLLCLLGDQLPRASKMHKIAVSRLNTNLSKTAGILAGTLYIPSNQIEYCLIDMIGFRIKDVLSYQSKRDCITRQLIFNSSTEKTTIPDNSLDYFFFDPPFGANLNYSELNYLWEVWLKVLTNNIPEAIENSVQKKGIDEYRKLMTLCFHEAYRILKPGRWMTVEFSNTKANIWNNIQTSLTDAGFIVSNISALDKKQHTIKALTTPTAVKQDLVISAYKPNGGFEERFVSESDEEGIWDFIRTHLGYLPIVKKQGNELVKIPERDSRILFDQVVAYFVRNLRDVPLSSKEFQEGLLERFTQRDDMIFLPEQVAEYDKARITSSQLRQITIFVNDEASSIEWLRQLLNDKPQTYQDIHPKFIHELSGYKKAEMQLELATLLEQNFLKFDGQGQLPPQIHSYLSSNFKELRNLSKDDTVLLRKAKDRWYVPNPEREEDLQKLRERALLKQFEEYKTHTGKKLKLVRMEALRCGFKKAWQERDYAAIIQVAEKIPALLLQEDQKLLMWYDQAQTRHSDSSLF
jgi:hypothetical protein